MIHTDCSGRVTSYSYDVLGRRTATTYPDGSMATAQYDAGDRLLQLVDSATGTLAWNYDDWDQVLSAQTAQGTIAYEYDAIGRRIGMTPAQQAKVEYRYDDLDRLTRILQGSEAVAFAYDRIGRLLETTLPNGVQTGYAYSDSDEVTGIAWKKADGSLIGDLGYAYNDVGQRIVQTGSYAPQLLPQNSTGTFDDNFRQTGYNGQALSYDANGNLLGDGQRTYVWNARDQLVEIRQGSSIVASFQYDALGRRIGKTEGGQSVSYLYDGLDAVQETHGNTVLPILTGAGIDQRFARTDNAGRTYFLTDAQGSTRALTDASGNVVQRYDYSPYGETQASGTGFNNPYQYTGRERDQSGLYYYRARYYDEGMKRFIAEDPIGLQAGINWYAYVYGNPVRYTDPLGLDVFLCKQPAFGISWNPIDHHWIKTDTVEAGMGGARGNVPGNESGDMPGDPVKVTNHAGRSAEKGSRCEKVEGVDEKKVNAQLRIDRPLGRWGPTNQCQSFVKDVLDNARTPGGP